VTSKERQIGPSLISPVVSRSLTSGGPDCWVHTQTLTAKHLPETCTHRPAQATSKNARPGAAGSTSEPAESCPARRRASRRRSTPARRRRCCRSSRPAEIRGSSRSPPPRRPRTPVGVHLRGIPGHLPCHGLPMSAHEVQIAGVQVVVVERGHHHDRVVRRPGDAQVHDRIRGARAGQRTWLRQHADCGRPLPGVRSSGPAKVVTCSAGPSAAGTARPS
jgi:hypothetical protein